MGNFRSGNGRGFSSGGGFSGGRGRSDRGGGDRGGRGGFGGRREGGFSSRDSGRPEMHEATCSKCGKKCQVPFRPTGSKPVYCSDCFRQTESGSSSSFSSNASSGISQEQFKQINVKLDKILSVLAELELDIDESAEDEDLEEDSEDSDEEIVI